ncbi:MAG: hypothetical protein ACI81R_002801 [Bradymonadia bacterium]|jgi:hypothetical protein
MTLRSILVRGATGKTGRATASSPLERRATPRRVRSASASLHPYPPPANFPMTADPEISALTSMSVSTAMMWIPFVTARIFTLGM